MDLETLRHSCSHIMASAVKKLYPEVKLGIGPAIEDGFYYDFDIPGGIKEADLEKIEKLMCQIVVQNQPFVRSVWPKEKAKEYFKQKGEIYKLELLDEIGDEEVSVYQHDDFIDLCRGPHVSSTGEVKYFKLLSISAAYWRGDETKAQLTRIYGTAFPSQEELDEYIKMLEETKKRDHRVLGKRLQLFDIFHDSAGAGLVFYLPRGAVLRRIIEDWEIKEHLRRGYKMVMTPHIMNKKLWEQSGHLEYYADYMYPIEKENQGFILKPMNCPGHIIIYKSQLHSWRDLPMRMFELGTVYRYEKSGVLHGLLRVRGFTQDDAHIFCRKDQLYEEIEGVLDFVKEAMRKFGFDNFEAELSTRPAKFIGERSDWDMAEEILESVLKKQSFQYQINPGDGAFYGPKIDIKLRDALKRSWQCATVQLDYSLPKRFGITYQDEEGNRQQVVMIHRVILGSIERFIATLTEHYAGAFPLWLAPVQVAVLSITEDVSEYARGVCDRLRDEGFRVEVDTRNETLQRKIREREMEKIPYLAIVGRKEAQDNRVSLRKRGGEKIGVVGIDEFIGRLKKEVGD